ncbi:MAG: gliding motility protein GldN [Prevotellaceae bacterium]|nr:gliding motility protein GldN [Prevotellaceae bacterium]
MKNILFTFITFCIVGTLHAQPQKSRVQNNRSATTKSATATDRASLMFPTAVDVPEDPSWRRDIYRTLDLQKDENAALYFPAEPQGDNMNLFTLLFRLLNTGKIPAYEYKLDGIEDFQQSNRMHFKDMLERYHIYYEIDGNSIKVEQSDIPSAEVLSFNVKESSYYDQNTATYHSRIVALCPVLHRSDDFSMDVRKYPMFWVKYDDIKTYLSGHEVMVSNLNNASRMSIDDFFATNHYKGDIYMTTNMQNRSLQQYCATDSLLKREQQRIEKEIVDFEEHIWKDPVDSLELAKQDSIAAAGNKKKSVSRKLSSDANITTRRGSSSVATKKEKSKSNGSSSSAGSAPRVSVRRQRH